ncbi:MAG TPA: c-type cytochrome [Usitatibacter sp.]|nr:c-type cytochrome [Usitatibacter sp.]
MMSRRLLHAALASLPIVVASLPAHSAGDATRGGTLYGSLCVGCHSLDENRVGPAHRGVFGRKAGSAPDYGYSSALASSRVVWSEETLDRWLTDPEKFIPGQKMSVSVAKEADRQDLIAYLKAQSRK